MSAIDGFAAVGYGAVGVLVLGWLAVSFMAPGRARAAVETASATAIFVALLSLFAHLAQSASAAGNGFAFYAFGFLCALFSCGSLVSLGRLVQMLRGGGSGPVSATN